MFKSIAIFVLLSIGIATQISFAENVEFKSDFKDEYGKPVMLTGILTKPEGDGPFPAVVLLHGCGGIQAGKPRSEAWSKRLVSWGYTTLQVDSFGPRGVKLVCGKPGRLILERARDAYNAKSFLANLHFVDQNRIAVLGWSHGGWVVMKATYDIYPLFLREETTPFRAAVAFYPYCGRPMHNLNSPLLILIGEKDDWTLAENCLNNMPSEPTEHEVILKVYPGAYHAFDWEGMDRLYKSHRLLYEPTAAQDSIIQAKSFLAKHLK